MPKKVRLPQARLLKLAVEARMMPDLRRFALLRPAAADLEGYPDWETSSQHVRVLDRVKHRSIHVANHEVRYIQDSGDEAAMWGTGGALPASLFSGLQITSLQRMGHRRWYVAGLEMSYQEAVDLFQLRFYPQEDPVRALGHQIRDVLYRVDSADEDEWRWHITFAPAPRSQAEQLLQYDFDAHWSPDQASSAARQLQERLSEVCLLIDADCYRETPDMPAGDWTEFVARSREKIERLSQVLMRSFVGEDAA